MRTPLPRSMSSGGGNIHRFHSLAVPRQPFRQNPNRTARLECSPESAIAQSRDDGGIAILLIPAAGKIPRIRGLLVIRLEELFGCRFTASSTMNVSKGRRAGAAANREEPANRPRDRVGNDGGPRLRLALFADAPPIRICARRGRQMQACPADAKPRKSS